MAGKRGHYVTVSTDGSAWVQVGPFPSKEYAEAYAAAPLVDDHQGKTTCTYSERERDDIIGLGVPAGWTPQEGQ